MLLIQVGTRAWSGEWSDGDLGGSTGYLRAGSNTDKRESDSTSCLQPRFRSVSQAEFGALLAAVCGDDSCATIKVTGSCEGGPECRGQSQNWCDQAAAGGSECRWVPAGDAPAAEEGAEDGASPELDDEGN